MELNISDLKRIANILFDHLEAHGHKKISIDSDFYWNVPKDQMYDNYDEPKEFNRGQLSADWQELQDILKNKKEPISYALVWLSSLIKKIGEDIIV